LRKQGVGFTRPVLSLLVIPIPPSVIPAHAGIYLLLLLRRSFSDRSNLNSQLATVFYCISLILYFLLTKNCKPKTVNRQLYFHLVFSLLTCTLQLATCNLFFFLHFFPSLNTNDYSLTTNLTGRLVDWQTGRLYLHLAPFLIFCFLTRNS